MFDVLIVGGGISGLITAVALRSSSLKVALMPGSSPSDSRKQSIAIVLNASSVELLLKIGLDVRSDAVTTVNTCNVSAKNHYGRIEFSAQDVGLDELGCVIMADVLEKRCRKILSQDSTIQVLPDAQMTAFKRAAEGRTEVHYLQQGSSHTVQARLLVACDGAASICRQQAGFELESANIDYRCMIVPVRLKTPHNGMSMQRFLAPGTCAFIPSTAREGRIVWTMSSAKVQARMHLPQSQLLRMVQHDCIAKLGVVEAIIGKPIEYPVLMQRARTLSKAGIVLIGNTASQFLPITAGGLNLTIRDVVFLRTMLMGETPLEWGSLQVNQYHQHRLSDHLHVYKSVHWLLCIFSTANPILSSVRSFGLVLARMPIVYRHLLRFALGESRLPLLQRVIDK